MLLILLLCLVLTALAAAFYLQHPKFGKLPAGAHLERIKKSPNYRDGQFKNLIATPAGTQGSSSFALWWELLFSKKERLAPADAVPSIKTNLLSLDKGKDTVIWLGHSSYFIQIGSKRILLDPVFSAYAAPVPFMNKAFDGANAYMAEEMPEIDYLLISHDHWDHLDYSTIMKLKPKIKNVICGLGVGAHFAYWGFAAQDIWEADWFTALEPEPNFAVHILPSRHFSGRLFNKNQTLWVGFALITPKRRIFFSGDSGYGPHFKQIGEMFNGFDLAIMENGQYDKSWPHIHMMPEEAAQAAEELKTKALLPGHAGKFAIARHAWDDPFRRITLASQGKQYKLLTPMIGEPVELQNPQQFFSRWWESIK
ncbi:MAG: MBL fold metallo-hydrolase [Negativicutes bacterium]|nr:MBL fold metallo-hydrolase [Negativicutes bacterium]